MAFIFSSSSARIVVEANNIFADVSFASKSNSSSRSQVITNATASILGAAAGAVVRSIIDNRINDVVTLLGWHVPGGQAAAELLPERPMKVEDVGRLRRVEFAIEPTSIRGKAFFLSDDTPIRNKSFTNSAGTVEGSGPQLETILSTENPATWSVGA